MNPITLLRAVTTVIAGIGIIVYLWLMLKRRLSAHFRIHGLIALSWLIGNYLYFWLTGGFPAAIHIAGATLALTSYIVAGGIYAIFDRH